MKEGPTQRTTQRLTTEADKKNESKGSMYNDVYRYRVNVKSLERLPLIGPSGGFAQKATFHVKPLDNGIEFDFDGGPVGGDTLHRCLLLQQRHYVVVEFPIGLLNTPGDWKKEIVNLALEEAAKHV